MFFKKFLSCQVRQKSSYLSGLTALFSAAEEQLELILEPAGLPVSILCLIIKITPTVDWKQSETELLCPSDRN